MSSEQKTALRHIRTFAQDAAMAQGKDGVATATEDTLVPPSVSLPAEKMAATKVFATQTPHQETSDIEKSTTSTQAEHIPAFHEIQKRAAAPEIKASASHATPTIPTIKAESAKKITVRAKKRDLKEKITASGGTIITDTKRNKTNFLDAFITSINTWFAGLNKKLTQKKTPTYTVTDVERRKGVVQKATSKTGTIFTADRETLKEEIRRRNQVIAQTPHDPDITWSPKTESGFALLETHEQPAAKPVKTPPSASKPERVFVEFKMKSLPEPIITQPSMPEPVIIPEAAPEVVQGYETFESALPPEPIVAPAPIVEPAQPPTAPVTKELIPEEFLEEALIESKPPVQQNLFERISDAIRFNTNALTLGIAGSVITILILVLVARALVTIILPGNTTASQTPAATALLASTTVTDLALPTLSQEVLLEKLKETQTISETAQEVRLTNKVGIPLATNTTLQLLGFAESKNLIPNVSEVHIVTINAQRAIILKVTDPTAAFGSILNWEPNMATDLQTFFGLTDPAPQASFSDSTIGKTDVRILVSDGEELLVYGFINGTTILITKDTTSFATILGTH